MEKDKIRLLITKYLDKKASDAEKETLLSWMKESHENEKVFLYQYDLWSLKQAKKFDYKKALRKIEFGETSKRIYIYVGSIAASLIVVLMSLWYLRTPDNNYNINVFNSQKIASSNNDIILSLSKDKKINISSKTIDIVYDDEGITMNNYPKIKKTSDSYNQLFIPNGKKGKLTLCDGTKLWIKSGTRIAYPSEMREKERKIYIDGEIYIEVAHNTAKPFIVKTNDVNVQVTGTKFDVAAYSNDKITKVALLQGGINVSLGNSNNNVKKIIPDQLYILKDKKESIKNVDATIFNAWINDEYICDNEKVIDTMNQLSRIYNKSIVCDSNISSLHFSGRLDLTKDIDVILSDFCEILPLKFENRSTGDIYIYNSQG